MTDTAGHLFGCYDQPRRLLDTRGGFLPIVLTCSFCGVGCAVRGFAVTVNELFVGAAIAALGCNLWTTVRL